MSRNRELSEQDIIRLLGRWKERSYPYPAGMKEKRRSAFLAAASALLAGGLAGGLAKATLAGKSISTSGGGHAATAPMTAGMKVTLGILSTVIIAVSSYLGVVIYNERDTLIDFLFGKGTPTPIMVVPTNSASSPNGSAGTPTSSPTATPTPSVTMSPTFPPTTSPGQNFVASPTVAPSATPIPPPTSTKPGLHVGQTRTPKPTKTPKK